MAYPREIYDSIHVLESLPRASSTLSSRVDAFIAPADTSTFSTRPQPQLPMIHSISVFRPSESLSPSWIFYKCGSASSNMDHAALDTKQIPQSSLEDRDISLGVADDDLYDLDCFLEWKRDRTQQAAGCAASDYSLSGNTGDHDWSSTCNNYSCSSDGDRKLIDSRDEFQSIDSGHLQSWNFENDLSTRNHKHIITASDCGACSTRAQFTTDIRDQELSITISNDPVAPCKSKSNCTHELATTDTSSSDLITKPRAWSLDTRIEILEIQNEAEIHQLKQRHAVELHLLSERHNVRYWGCRSYD